MRVAFPCLAYRALAFSRFVEPPVSPAAPSCARTCVAGGLRGDGGWRGGGRRLGRRGVVVALERAHLRFELAALLGAGLPQLSAGLPESISSKKILRELNLQILGKIGRVADSSLGSFFASDRAL